MSERIKIGIIGGAGYVAGELLRILMNHPFAIIKYVQSESQQDKLVSSIHSDLEGECSLRFVGSWSADADVLFLCGGHQQSTIFLTENQIPATVKIIDMSQDFRLRLTKNSHGRSFIYGLSEHNREQIKATGSVANPGCFATAITLSLLPVIPLVKNEVHIHAITGSTGSGQSLSPGVNFNWRSNNVSIYKAFSHQHLDEINETLKDAHPDFKAVVNFLPVRGNFTRGIFTSIYFKSDITADELQSRFRTRYQNDPFVVITDMAPDLKQAVNTNRILINAAKYDDKILIISAMDNLLKGASGQAVQNMNLLFGLDETTGLKLKSVAF
ncbi:N-acetyl-gamma-glutamyl-phosphate reductase [Mucilaginibacter ginsenosidivorans]|uniref:N-acetyl-gamma-glutamyl-phosphate reductase n=1 Tax=Mucilaginibacter ginsenosidivorans TaxID=398053 RepID=A0A5B8UTR9_9SPHI|nr:N-acetyl-gamma-glutamyl-phosphate reductase [Mucilaginibacter ginsenosidivorans]QEC62302.1 N-acetyl-gamma-glutamyl-phosphate reductase [Mucilaginibacter ginsenosidivorans]